MFYRPNFCCHCGEKIERARWTPMTSRRFCEFCEIEQKEHELLPKVAVAAALLVGAAGLTAYLNSGADATTASKHGSAVPARELKSDVAEARSEPPRPVDSPATDTRITTSSNAALPNNLQRLAPNDSSTEPVHYCGAMTRKGTPCSRRVKARGRCWQHLGQSAGDELRR